MFLLRMLNKKERNENSKPAIIWYVHEDSLRRWQHLEAKQDQPGLVER